MDAYRRFGIHNKAWDAQVIRLFEGRIRLSCGLKGAPSWEDVSAQEATLRKLHCSDPLFLAVCAIDSRSQDASAQATEDLLRRAVAGFGKTRYPRGDPLQAACELGKSLAKRVENAGEVARLRALAASWAAAALTDGSYRKGEEEICLRDAAWDEPEFLEILQTALAKKKGVDPYVLGVIRGRCEINRAWDARGGGWGSEVSAQGWRGFRTHLARARAELTRAWKLHPEYPEAPAEMITVTMGEDRPAESPRVWFDRTVAAEMNYMDAYDKLTQALLPRWGGSLDAMHSFAIECLRTGRYDTWVPYRYFRLLRRIASEQGGRRDYWTRSSTYGYLKEMCEGYARREDPAFWRSLLAAGAWYCDRPAEARRLIDRLGKGFRQDVFREYFDTSPATALAEIRSGGTTGRR